MRERTVGSIRAQCGTCVPSGTAFGNLRVKDPLVHDSRPPSNRPRLSTHVKGAKVAVQLDAYSTQLNCG
jgi:hypothetical protein